MVKSFNEKIDECYALFSDIDKPTYPRNKLFLYSDFIELLILYSNEDGVSVGDVQDRFFGTKNYKNPEEKDKDEAFINNIFRIIVERINLYKEDYPFENTNQNLLVIKKQLIWRHKLYLTLLASSMLNVFKSFQSTLTSEFENFSAVALKNYLPKDSIIKEFGKNSPYKGNAKTRIKLLADDLGIGVNKTNIEAIDPLNNQERGLDVIGWMPFEDTCKNKIVFLCQCACGKDFDSKFHETIRFKNYINFYRTTPQYTMFIPYSMININDKEFLHTDIFIDSFLIFTRKRILSLNKNRDLFKNSESFKVVNSLIKKQGSFA
jgi:hypothetical protein